MPPNVGRRDFTSAAATAATKTTGTNLYPSPSVAAVDHERVMCRSQNVFSPFHWGIVFLSSFTPFYVDKQYISKGGGAFSFLKGMKTNFF